MDILAESLNLVNQWLKFAEAKNGVVVALTGAAMLGTTRLIISDETKCLFKIYLYILVIFLLGAFIISLLSFLPKLHTPKSTNHKPETEESNLLFFGHLATLDKGSLLKHYQESMNLDGNDLTKIHGMYAEQIIANSRIAVAKYKSFTVAVKLLLCGLLTPLIAMPLIRWYSKH